MQYSETNSIRGGLQGDPGFVGPEVYSFTLLMCIKFANIKRIMEINVFK